MHSSSLAVIAGMGICFKIDINPFCARMFLIRKLTLTPSAVSKLLVWGRQDGLAKTMAKEIFNLKWPKKEVEKSV
jgi:hypothetical protein